MPIKENINYLSELIKSNEVDFTISNLETTSLQIKNAIFNWLDSEGFIPDHIEHEYVKVILSNATCLLFIKLFVQSATFCTGTIVFKVTGGKCTYLVDNIKCID